MSVLAFAGSGVLVLSGLGMVAIGVARGFAAPGHGTASGAIGGALVGFLYLMMACLYVAPGVLLHRYAGAISRLKATGTSGALEDVLRHQRSFWRFLGALSIAGVVLSIGLVALLVVLGVMGAVFSGRT